MDRCCSLDDILPKLEGVKVVVPERKTFYGNPCGTVVGFAGVTAE